MKSRPRIFSAIILTPPSTGVTSSAASSAPRTSPLRRIVEARTASANAAPTQGTIRVSLVMKTSAATYVPAARSAYWCAAARSAGGILISSGCEAT